jgi:alcohol dehydrogenase class IV
MFNIRASASKYATLSRIMGISGRHSSDEIATLALVEAVRCLNGDMRIDIRQPELRVSREYWPELISQTLVSGSTKSNPVEVSPEDIERILGSLHQHGVLP